VDSGYPSGTVGTVGRMGILCSSGQPYLIDNRGREPGAADCGESKTRARKAAGRRTKS
jgi:hypothetical protein